MDEFNKTSYDTSLTNFLKMFLSNIDGAIKIKSAPFQIISDADEYWQRLFFDGKINSENRVAYNLMNHGHNIFRSCITLSFSGHTAPVSSVLRSSLECCLYAFLVSQKPELGHVWLNRSENSSGRTKCINAFKPHIIFDVLKGVDEDLAKKCRLFYEDLIDFGAHPNVNGVFSNIELIKMTDHDQVHIHYLHGNGRETATAILSCCILIQIALELACYSMPQKSKEHEITKYLEKFRLDLNQITEQLKRHADHRD